MSQKNKLQELLVKKNLPIPSYVTARVGEEDHYPSWKSIVTFQTKKDDVTEITGPLCNTKKSAELAVAKIAIDSLREDRIPITLKKPFTILIDIENQPKALGHIHNTIELTSSVYGFISEGHPLVSRMKKNEETIHQFKLIVVPSTRPNGVDVGMCMKVNGVSDDIILIVSGDNFAHALCDCVNSEGFINKKKFCKVFHSSEDLIDWLSRL
jgi:hypothetical protein